MAPQYDIPPHRSIDLEWYYRDLEIVFSGRRGFHVHVLDFNPGDWTPQRGKSTTRFHAEARYSFALRLQLQTFRWTRSHFTLSVDPCRVVAVPSTLDARTGLVTLLMWSRRDLERRDPYSIVEAADALKYLPPASRSRGGLEPDETPLARCLDRKMGSL